MAPLTNNSSSAPASKELFHCDMTKGSSMNIHVLRMIDYFNKLGQLGFITDHELSVDLVL